MDLIFLSFSVAVLLSVALDRFYKEAERLFFFSILRILLVLPAIIGSYLFAYFNFGHRIYLSLMAAEIILALLMMMLARRLFYATDQKRYSAIFGLLFFIGFGTIACALGYIYSGRTIADFLGSDVVFSRFGLIYFMSVYLIVGSLMLIWRVEIFWRSLTPADRWRYKYLITGLLFISIVFSWTASFRMVFLRLIQDNFLQLAVACALSWLLMVYAIIRHRLLNSKIFISRKVVYATIAPIAISGLFFFVGTLSLLSRLFGWSVPFILQLMIISLGVLAVIVYALSDGFRKRVRHFISTHFYVNKYEYRDEWLAFSNLLQGELTEMAVVRAMYQILRDCLYTDTILIWLGEVKGGFYPAAAHDDQEEPNNAIIVGDDPLVTYLLRCPYLYSGEKNPDSRQKAVLVQKASFMQKHGIVLMTPMILGKQCVGFIGLGPETTGSRYGRDDFDLLAALCSHAASALLAVKHAETLAQNRELSLWSNLSAFVLHDVKNAATMLELVRRNAPEHIEKPEFQRDMLESIDDALARMAKIQGRLTPLGKKMLPSPEMVDLDALLREHCSALQKKISNLQINLMCPQRLMLPADPDFIHQILENLLLNAREAGGNKTVVSIVVTLNSVLTIEIQDNGPGIAPDLLPRRLFEPFKTNKQNGSGIGLWQVEQLVKGLNGEIRARNIPHGGAGFTLRFPLLKNL